MLQYIMLVCCYVVAMLFWVVHRGFLGGFLMDATSPNLKGLTLYVFKFWPLYMARFPRSMWLKPFNNCEFTVVIQ